MAKEKVRVKTLLTADILIPTILQTIFFGTSSLVNVLLMVTIGNSPLSQFVMGAIAVGLSVANGYYFSKATDDQLPKGHRAGYFIISLLCFSVSIMGTLSFGSCETNIAENEIVANNTIAELQQKEINGKITDKAKIQAKIDKLEAEKKEAVAKYHPVTRKTMREQIKARYDKDIKDLYTQKNAVDKRKSDAKEVKTVKLSTTGFGAIFDNIKKNGMDAEMMFLIYLAILCEAIWIFSHLARKRNSRRVLRQYTVYEDLFDIKSTYSPTPDKLPEIQSGTELTNNNTAKVIDIDTGKKSKEPVKACIQGIAEKKEIGFRMEKQEGKAKKEAIKKYAQHVIDNPKKDNSCTGVTTMSKQIGYDRTELLKAKAYLEQKDILEVRGGYTYVIDIEGLKKHL